MLIVKDAMLCVVKVYASYHLTIKTKFPEQFNYFKLHLISEGCKH